MKMIAMSVFPSGKCSGQLVRFWLIGVLLLTVHLVGCGPANPVIQGFIVDPSGVLQPKRSMSIGLVIAHPTPDLQATWSCRLGQVHTNGGLSSLYTAIRPGTDVVQVELFRKGRALTHAEIVIIVVGDVVSPIPTEVEGPHPTIPLATSGSSPLIRVDVFPPFGPGGEFPLEEISGTVSNVTPKSCRIVIYSLAANDTYFVQPSLDRPFVDILDTGSWSARIRLGREYWVLLVRAGYTNPPTKLQREPTKDQNILEILRIRDQK